MLNVYCLNDGDWDIVLEKLVDFVIKCKGFLGWVLNCNLVWSFVINVLDIFVSFFNNLDVMIIIVLKFYIKLDYVYCGNCFNNILFFVFFMLCVLFFVM